MERSQEDDLLIVAALARYSYEFEGADPEHADRAWELAIEIAAKHDLSPSEAAEEIRCNLR